MRDGNTLVVLHNDSQTKRVLSIFFCVMNTTKQNQQNNKSTRFKYEKRKYNSFELGVFFPSSTANNKTATCVCGEELAKVEMRIASSALSELEVLLSSARSLATNFLLQKNLVEIIHPSDLLCDVHFM